MVHGQGWAYLQEMGHLPVRGSFRPGRNSVAALSSHFFMVAFRLSRKAGKKKKTIFLTWG
jgi:hypothetical protein